MQRHADWIVPDWPAPAPVAAFMTTRAGGFSEPPFDSLNLGTHVGDDPGTVARNRARLREALPAEPVWLRQVHGTHVARPDAGFHGEEADAAVTRAPHTVCAVMVADCLPVLFCDLEASVVACAHAGWRGLSGGVLEATLAAMGCPPGRVVAWLGPAIGPRAFEVGADVHEAFVSHHGQDEACFRPKAPGTRGESKWWADLAGLARRRLGRAGIHAVHGGHDCTVEDRARFFSHRRDGRSGRHAALIWLRAR
ncbi:MAG: peptidoglycan editing factor PgeF [Burkholderiales bacterium]|nr:peptidoglycan editing factor PgeF [Burkholderiales bacterium]